MLYKLFHLFIKVFFNEHRGVCLFFPLLKIIIDFERGEEDLLCTMTLVGSGQVTCNQATNISVAKCINLHVVLERDRQ